MNWISIKDRLPPLYDFVLVFADNKGTNEPKPYSIARWNSSSWEFINHSPCMPNYGAYQDIEYPIDSDSVTHWMPLPEEPDDEIIAIDKMLQEDYDNMMNKTWIPTDETI